MKDVVDLDTDAQRTAVEVAGGWYGPIVDLVPTALAALERRGTARPA